MVTVNPPQPGPQPEPQPGPQPGLQLGPQPDFARLTQGLQQASNELGNFANLPDFAQGNATMQQIQQFQQLMQHQMQQGQQQMEQVQQQMQQMQQQQQQFQQQMTNMQQQMAQNHTTIRNEIQTLRNETRTHHRAAEYNSIVRIQNSGARTPDTLLAALRDYTTNADIPGFPATPAQLASLSSAALDPILRALDLPTNDTLAVRRQRLKFYIGLADLP